MGRSPCVVALLLGVVSCAEEPTAIATDTGTGGSTVADGSTSTSSSGTQSGTGSTGTAEGSSTGDTPCGNGELDEGEVCDDGDDDDLDGCRSDCTFGFEEVWTISYDGPASEADVFNGVLIDAVGNVYVVGNHRVPAQAANLIVKQYTPDGREGWTYEYAGVVESNDFGASLHWHPSGDLLVVGTNVTPLEADNMLVIRLSKDDQTAVWIDSYDGPGTDDDSDGGNDIVADPDGNVIAIGSQRVDGQQFDIVVRKYDPDGNELWTRSHGGAAAGWDVGIGVRTDESGNVYALGREEVEGQGDDGWLRKYDPDGNELWTHRFDWVANTIARDAEGNLVLAGLAFSQAGAADVAIEKLDPDLAQLWGFSADLGSGENDVVTDVTVDVDGSVYATGLVVHPGEVENVLTLKLDTDGIPQWAWTYDNEMASLTDQGAGIAVDLDGNVLVAGHETVFGMQENGWLRKVAQP